MKVWMKILNGEAGMMVLQLMLLLVMVAALLLPPLLSLIGTASNVGKMEERKTQEFYSADAGITAGRWRITQGNLPTWMVPIGDSRWFESTFAHTPAYENYTLSAGDPINDKTVVYQITPKWTLGEGTSALETYNSTQKRDPAVYIAVYAGYNGAGSVAGQAKYKIDIRYPGGDGTVNVSRIGCWLPAGFNYVSGSSNLEKTGIMALKKTPVVSNYRGGQTITWNYTTPIDYNTFLQLAESGLSQASITFEYTPGADPSGDFGWIRTDKTTGVDYLAWDMDIKLWEIKSTATSPTGEKSTATAYTYTKAATPFGSTMEGDCLAFGNTLMRNTDGSNPRDTLDKESSYTVSAIPANATIKYIYLYWSGWKCKPWNGMGSSDNWTLRCETYNVDKVKLQVAYPAASAPLLAENITASQKRGAYDSDHGGWSYACFADITDRVKNAFTGTPGFVGNGKYTVGHYNMVPSSPAPPTSYTSLYDGSSTILGKTLYPLGSTRDGGARNTATSPYYENYNVQDEWAYAAWSIIVVYSSPTTVGHLLRIYDTFQYLGENANIPITFAGFQTPPLAAENTAARYTHFVGEGDSAYNESVTVQGSGNLYTLSDTDNPSNNVCNNQCRIPPITDPNPGTLIQGIDIDTFNIPKTCIKPGDTQAIVTFKTVSDGMNLIYMILSFRSMFTPGGISIYKVE